MFKGLKVGDNVWVAEHRGGAIREVTQVGRKYFIAGRSQFRLSDGTSTGGYSYPHAYSLEHHERDLRIEEARKELAAFGVLFDWHTKDEKILLVHEALKPHMTNAC